MLVQLRVTCSTCSLSVFTNSTLFFDERFAFFPVRVHRDQRNCRFPLLLTYQVLPLTFHSKKLFQDFFLFNLFPAGTTKSLSIPLKFFALATVGKE